MNQQEFRQRINTLLAEDAKNPLRWWYLSYAGEDGFHGAIVIRAHGMVEACYLSRHRNVSPGGQVWAVPIPDDRIPAPEYCNRLLQIPDIEAIWGKGKLMTLEEIIEMENEENDG